MSVEVKKGENSTYTFEIAVEAAEVDRAFEKTVKEAVRHVVVPGFRKGKAPLKLAERQISRDLIMQQVRDLLLPKALQDAIEKEQLTPLAEPSIEIKELEKGKDFKFTALIEVKPEVDLEGYKGLEIEQEKPEVKDEDVEKTIHIMQENAARFEDIGEDRGLDAGDMAIVDFESISEGRPVDKGSATNYQMEIREDMFIPGFIDHLRGLKKGEEKTFSMAFPEDYPSDLKGKPVDFHFKLHGIKKKVLSDLNDDFAKEVSRFQTLEELRNDIKEKLVKKVDEQTRAQVEDSIAEKLLGKVAISLPPSLVAYEQQMMLDDMRRNFAAKGLSFEDYVRKNQSEVVSYLESLKPQAERIGKLEIALEAVAKKENIAVSDEEVEAKVKEIAGELKQDFGALKENLQKEGRLAGLKYAMLKKKAMEFLVANAVISYVPLRKEKGGPEEEKAVEALASE
ncbi:MAG: trigger factor [Candidatus Eremiobacteraeota bacterium]|nr:trigger factor [Candidatus Eremiobacteraeota bacterium]